MKKNKTKLKLPFKGNWLVFWGGDSFKINHHHKVENQKHAFDFVAVDDKGKEYRGDGKQNKDYFSFGKDVLAPAKGKVVEAFDGIKDNTPGVMKSYVAIGNAVIIKHSEDEYSVLAHLKQGTVKVKVGDKIEQGEVIGQCGNSGNSSEPHLHYHLQNKLSPHKAEGIKCFFNLKVKKDKKFETKKQYSPVKGDIISSI